MFGIKRSEDRNQDARDNLIAYQRCFSSESGKKVILDLINKYHVLTTHKGDPYLEGQRSVVLDILRQTKINVAEFDKLLNGE